MNAFKDGRDDLREKSKLQILKLQKENEKRRTTYDA